MPASLFHIDSTDPTASPGCLEDQRALQLALELSMLGLPSESDPITGPFDPDSRGKKSQNTTECVPVPSSEHVAEIVGRQGKFSHSPKTKTLSPSPSFCLSFTRNNRETSCLSQFRCNLLFIGHKYIHFVGH